MGTLEFHVQRQHLPVVFRNAVQLFGELFFQTGVAGDAQQGGACAGEAEGRAGGAHQRLDFFVVRNQLFPVVLVEPVLHGGAQELFVPQLQGFEHQRAVGDVVNGVPPVDLLRQYGAGEGGGQGKVRDQRQKFPPRVEGEADAHRQTAVHHGGGEAAEKGGSQVVRVPFHGVGDVE